MALKKLPAPPRFPIVDDQGKLTAEGRRWFDVLYEKLGQSGGIPSESLSPKSVINASNNAKVDWLDVNAAAGLVRVYGPSGVASGWNRFEGTDTGFRTLGPFSAASFSKAYGMIYYVAYDPATSTYIVTNDFRETLRDGLYFVGIVRANASFGGSGATAGGGGSATAPPGSPSGVGGGTEDPTIGIKPGFGFLS